jgi:hypothetical protein
MLPSRWASLVRAGYGAALICSPGTLIQLCTHGRPSRRACAVGRVLGARQVAQALIAAAFPTRRLIAAGVTVDLAHAVSMLALAARDGELRPALLTESAIAGAFAADGCGVLHVAGR